MTRRALFSMTIDPEGAMDDWVDPPPGWTIEPLPTQEAVLVLGIAGYQELVAETCLRERPDVLVTHPPYDYLDEPTADRVRAAGTRVIGYAFDDEIFAHAYDARTRARLARVYDRYVTTREVRWATRPIGPLPAGHGAPLDVVLVGRAWGRRVELVEALRAAGIAVTTRGAGWPGGFVSRAAMEALYARARVVLTTGDWEGHAVPMVKHRLLDTAMLGAFQIAQWSEDLRGYFPADEVPDYRDADELVARVRAALADPDGRQAAAARARARAVREHTWRTRFAELVDGVPLRADPGPASGSGSDAGAGAGDRAFAPILTQLLLALATRAEAQGRPAAASAIARQLLVRRPDEPTAAAILGRCLLDRGDADGAHAWLARAAAAPSPPCAAALHCGIPGVAVGTGLGRLGLFPPAAEPVIGVVQALCAQDRLADAASVLAAVDEPAVAAALVATVRFPDDPAFAPLHAARATLAAVAARAAGARST